METLRVAIIDDAFKRNGKDADDFVRRDYETSFMKHNLEIASTAGDFKEVEHEVKSYAEKGVQAVLVDSQFVLNDPRDYSTQLAEMVHEEPANSDLPCFLWSTQDIPVNQLDPQRIRHLDGILPSAAKYDASIIEGIFETLDIQNLRKMRLGRDEPFRLGLAR